MSSRLYVATRKGLFELSARPGGVGGRRYAVSRRPGLGGAGRSPTVPSMPRSTSAISAPSCGGARRPATGRRSRCRPSRQSPRTAGDDPHPWSLGKIWVLEPGGVAGRLWAGTMPGGLFRSDDGGASWSLNEALWHMPERRQWAGVAGGEQPGINSVLIDPRDPADIRIGVSTAGVWASPTAAPRGSSSTAACMPNTCRPSCARSRSPRTCTGSRAAPRIPRSCGASTTTASSVPRMPAPTGAS